MARRIVVAVVLLTVSGGIAYVAAQATAARPNTGTTPKATQSGTFTVATGQTGGAKVLPLTGITISGVCVAMTDVVVARAVFEAASGKTMDAFVGGAGTVGGTSMTIPFVGNGTGGGAPNPGQQFGAAPVVANSNGATASITVGGVGDYGAGTCTFLWQAVEAPN